MLIFTWGRGLGEVSVNEEVRYEPFNLAPSNCRFGFFPNKEITEFGFAPNSQFYEKIIKTAIANINRELTTIGFSDEEELNWWVRNQTDSVSAIYFDSNFQDVMDKLN